MCKRCALLDESNWNLAINEMQAFFFALNLLVTTMLHLYLTNGYAILTPNYYEYRTRTFDDVRYTIEVTCRHILL